MRIKFDHVFQFKVTLKGVKPPIWRRILVPCDYTFWDLHVAIQDAMGWFDCHLHAFYMRHPGTRFELQIGIPAEETFMEDDPVLPGWMIPIAELFTLTARRATYEYDFGDGWEHDIFMEKILLRDKSAQYPVCTGGRRACPPEDCGGIGGYGDFLAAVADPAHAEHAALLEWVGGSFNPKHFDKNEIQFDDPRQRWELAFRQETEADNLLHLHQEDTDGILMFPGQGSSPGGDRPSSPAGIGQGRGWETAVGRLPQSVELLREQAGQGFRGYPVATVVLYGPNDKHATKAAAGIIGWEGAVADPLKRWYAKEGDIRESAAIGQEILAFIKEHDVRSVVLSDGIMGCPHEEGIDYPVGEVCPECPFWAYHDRRTGEPIQ